MKVYDALFELIQSLSKNEKRFFQLFTGLQQGDKAYIQLFNWFLKQKTYDDTQLKAAFPEWSKSQKLNNIKNYLYQQLLKALRIYSSGNESPKTKILNLLQASEILYRRGLLEQCEIQLQKARKIAQHYLEQQLELAIIHWEKKLLRKYLYREQTLQKIESLFAAEMQLTTELQNTSSFWHLNYQFFKLNLSKGSQLADQERQTIDAIINQPLLASVNNALTAEAKIYYYDCYSKYYNATRQPEKAYQMQNKIAELFETYPVLIETDPGRYMTLLGNLSMYEIRCRRFTAAEKNIKKLRSLLLDSIDLQTDRFIWLYQSIFNLYIDQYLYDVAAKELMPAFLNDYKKYQARLAQVFKLMFHFLNFLIYFGAQQFRDALRALDFFFQKSTDETIRPLTHQAAKVLQIILHFELGNIDMVILLCKRLEKKYQHNKDAFPLHFLIIHHFYKLINTPTTTDAQHQLWQKLQTEFEMLESQSQWQDLMGHFDFAAWALAHRLNISYAQAQQTLKPIQTEN
jgi:hypothetical protein